MKTQKTAFSVSVAAAAVFGIFAATNVHANADLAEQIENNAASIRQNVIAISSQAQQIGDLRSSANTQKANISANKAAIDAQNEKIETNAAGIRQNVIAISSQAQQIGDLRSSANARKAEITANSTAIAANQEAVAGVQEQIKQNTAAIGTNTQKIDNNAYNIRQNLNAINNQAQLIGDLRSNANARKAEIAANATAIAETQEHIKQNTAAIGTNTQKINGLAQQSQNQAQQIENTQRALAGHADAIDHNQNRIIQNAGLIDAADKRSQSNANRIADNLKAINSNKTAIERITRTVDPKLADDVARNSQAIQNGTAAVEAQGRRIGELENHSETNRQNIAANLQAINTNAAAIDANKAAIERIGTQNAAQLQQLEQKVGNLDQKVKRGFASQAALSGLFQPYHVGKLNVSAAVGGYQSETAVAVGSGYRFSDRFAAKAGVSLNTRGGGAAYNVGFNFEW